MAIDMEDPRNGSPRIWGFTDHDLERLKFPDLTLIWSFPVFNLNKDGNPTGPILGTVNLDSLQKDAFKILVGNAAIRAEVERMMQELADVVSKIASC